MPLLADTQDAFGGPREARFPDWATDTLPNDVDGGGHRITNFKFDKLGAAVMFASNEAPGDADLDGDGSEGTLATDYLQDVLDTALTQPLILYWDIKALLGSEGTAQCLTIRPNTTIITLPGCGAILEAETTASYLLATDLFTTPYANKNISLIGGIWNGNGANQINRNHVVSGYPGINGNDRAEPGYEVATKSVLRFHRCENLYLQDLLILNQMVYGIVTSEWRQMRARNIRFLIEEAYLTSIDPSGYPLPYAMNWDGMHFQGPGDDTILYDITGNGDDDLIALNTNENTVQGDSRRLADGDDYAITNFRVKGLRLEGGASIRVWGEAEADTPGYVDQIHFEDVSGNIYGRNAWEPATGATIGRMTINGYDVTDDNVSSHAEDIKVASCASLRLDRIAPHVRLELTDVAVEGDAFDDKYIEGVRAVGSPLSLTHGTPANVTSVDLTPGTWFMDGMVGYIFGAASEIDYLSVGVSDSDASATLPTAEHVNNNEIPFGPLSKTGSFTQIVSPRILIVTGNVTVYLVTKVGITASTLTAYGKLRARRMNVPNTLV